MLEFDEFTQKDLQTVTSAIEEYMESMGAPMRATSQVMIALDEILSNIVKFAYPGTVGYASVDYEPLPDSNGIRIVFTDYGVPYNPLLQEDPDITLSAREREAGGLGIFMVKKTMSDITYRYEDNKNILTIIKLFA